LNCTAELQSRPFILQETMTLKFRTFTATRQASIIVLALASACSTLSWAQDTQSHTDAQQQKVNAADQTAESNLIKIIRDATEKYQDYKMAEASGYVLQFGCVSGDDFGAMGLHYINPTLINNAVLDPTRPQIIIYEPLPGGGRKLIGVDFLLLADPWNANHSSPPQLMGQMFHLFTAPNRFGLPNFYTLHVWAWKDNPKGAFVNWHSNVSCKPFTGQ
jgi:hypothetical protein